MSERVKNMIEIGLVSCELRFGVLHLMARFILRKIYNSSNSDARHGQPKPWVPNWGLHCIIRLMKIKI